MDKMDELCVQFKKKDLGLYINYNEIKDYGQILLNGIDSITNPILSLIQKNRYEIMKRGDLEGNKDYKHLISYFIVFDPFNKKILSYQRTSHSGEQRLVGNKSIGWGGHIGFNDFKSHIDYRIDDLDNYKIENVTNNGQRTFFFKKELYEEITGFNSKKIKIIPNPFNYNIDIDLKGEDFIVNAPKRIVDLYNLYIIHKQNMKEIKDDLSIFYGRENEFMLLSDDYFMLNDNRNTVSKDHLGVTHVLSYFNKNKNGLNLKSNEQNNTNLEWKTIEELKEQVSKDEHEYESWSTVLINELFEYLK